MIQVDPDTFDTDDYVDLTITAVDTSGNVVTTYNGDIFIEII